MIKRIETPYMDSKYFGFLDGNLYLENTQKTFVPSRIVDALANFWCLAYALDLPQGLLSLFRHGQPLPVIGNMGLFIPPFSILDWRLNIGQFEWKSVLMFSEPPETAPKFATLFPLNYELPFTKSGINSEIFDQIKKSGQRVDKEEKLIPLSLKVKRAIDLNFNSSISIGDIAKNINSTASPISRAFKITYDISPLFYRNQLRVFDASLKLLKGETVTEAAHEVGFQDLSRFNKQFKEKMRAIPSQFKSVVPTK
jgi:AraC-like DNA-binding protein